MNTYYLNKEISFGTQTVTLGTLPPGAWVERAGIHVITAFNSDGTDNISLGYDTDNDAYVTATAVNSTGRKTVTMGTGIGYDATARTVKAYYVNGGSEPTTGKAKVYIEYTLHSA